MSSPYELFCATEGYFDRQDRHNRRTRELWHLFFCANSEKKDRQPKETLWPIFGDGSEAKETPSMAATSPDMIRQILKAHNINQPKL